MFRSRYHGLALSFFFLGCQPEEQPQPIEQPIIHGSLDTIATHDAVVSLTDNTGFSFCTGTFVGLRTIVSAGHCLEGGAPTKAFFGLDAADAAANCGVSANCGFFPIVAFDDPGFNGNTLLNDLSVLRLGQDPTINGLPVAPIPFTRFTDGTNLSAADEGSLVSFSGYGVTNGVTQTGGDIRLVVDGIPLVKVGPANVGGTAGSIDANQVFYRQPVTIGGPCSGDSGGPMFVIRNGVEFLAAVTSFGDFNCEVDGVSTRVDQFEAFIETFCGAPNCGQGAPACNNDNVLDPGEACDGADLGGQTCDSIGFDTGTLACNASCGFDDSGCAKSNTADEVCNNNADDDADGKKDCNDPDCADAFNCRTTIENCLDGIDNDGNGAIDCNDTDCVNEDVCQEGGCATIPTSPRNESAALSLLALFGLSLFISRRAQK